MVQEVVPERRPRARSFRLPEAGYPDRALACGLASLGEVSPEPLPDGERRSWGSMVESHHPKGWSRAPGGRILYWIRSSPHRVLGSALRRRRLPAGAARRLRRPRADARMANIGLAVCDNRLLILPGVRVRGLASQALRLAAERVAGDWEDR